MNDSVMKTITIFFLILSGFYIYAQDDVPEIPLDPDTHKVKFQETIDEDGTKEELFNRCVYWLNGFYKDPTRITTVRDIGTGKIIGRHQFRIHYTGEADIKQSAGMVRYTFTIQFKENKYRYTLDEIVLKAKTNVPVEKWMDKDDPAYDPRWDSYLQQIADYVNDWRSSLKEKMKPETKKAEDDW